VAHQVPHEEPFHSISEPSPFSPKWWIRFYLVTFVKIGRDDVTATGAASIAGASGDAASSPTGEAGRAA
jgi:hypothetical protein